MAKTVSVAELSHGGVSRAIKAAETEPVLVSKENRPSAWIVSAAELARVAAERGEESATVYQRALELLAIDLYQRDVLTLGLAAKLAGMALADFIDLCGRLQAPVLWEPKAGIVAEVDALTAALDDTDTHRGD